jgi:translation initiation factor IF-2
MGLRGPDPLRGGPEIPGRDKGRRPPGADRRGPAEAAKDGVKAKSRRGRGPKFDEEILLVDDADLGHLGHRNRRADGTRIIIGDEDGEPRRPASARGHRRAQRREDAPDQEGPVQFKNEKPNESITVSHGMTVREFAEKLGVKSKDLIKLLFHKGFMATINHVLEPEMAVQLASELGIEALQVSFEEEIQLRHETAATEAGVERAGRAPVVTVMGHVDHGKTTLLDAIRETKVAQGEAGGITQHIGAYHVDVGNRQVVFLDTPGHEAFTMMRARGASVTDIVVLVVAADDGVMPQTIEAIDHAKAAKVAIVVAINKIDKPNANLDRVRKELSDHGLLVEEWGGQTTSVKVSALKKEGINELLDMLLLTADLLELKAGPTLPAQGVVLEARKEVGRGIVATVLVQDGTLATGDVFVAGSTWGRVRSMTDDRGKRLKKSGPATAVEVTGFDELPNAGDKFQAYDDEGKVREIASYRSQEERTRDLAPKPQKITLETLFSQIDKNEIRELAVIVKADVNGSVEVLRDMLQKQAQSEKVRLNVIHAQVGAISTNDVLLASASNAIVVGFNVRPERNAATLAEKEGVDIRLHTVVYELIDEIKKSMAGLLEPTIKEVHRGTAEIRETFKVPKAGTVSGCYVVDGVIPRTAQIRLLRDNVVIFEGKLASLRRFKDDVSEVRAGFECGIGIENYQDVKPGDNIEAFVREKIAATL